MPVADPARARDLVLMDEPDESAKPRDDQDHRLDDRAPRDPLRGPLTFGVIAATLQLGALLWLVNC